MATAILAAAAAAAADKTAKAALKENEKKWGKTLMAAGWTCVPSTIILRQRALGLDSIDMNLILIIAAHWWTANKLAFPSKKLFAETLGIDVSTVRKRLARLEATGMVKRILRPHAGKRHETSLYQLDGLIKGATPFAEEELHVRAEKAASGTRRAARKGVLSLVTVP